MITRNRKNSSIKKTRAPLVDKTNLTDFPNSHKKPNTKPTKQTNISTGLSETNRSTQFKTDDSEINSNKKVNLQCVESVESKMPNVQNTKRTGSKRAIKQKTVKANNKKSTTTSEKGQKDDNLDPKFFKNVSVIFNKCEEVETQLKSNNKQQKIGKHVKFENKKINILTTPKFEKALRRRRTKNYVESSLSENSNLKLEESKNNEPVKKVPVYLQSDVNEQKQKSDDPFEFIPDSPRKKRRKGKKEIRLKKGKYVEELSDSDSDSTVYDKSMHEVLKDVREKEKKKKLAKIQTQKKNQIKNAEKEVVFSKSNNKVEHVNEASTKIVNVVVNKVTNKDIINQLSKQIRFLNRKIFLSSDGNFDLPSKENENSDDKYFGFDVGCNEDDVITMLPPIQKSSIRKRLDNIRPISENISRKFTSLTSTPIPVTRKPNKKILELSKTTNPPKKINVISNILLSPSKNTRKVSSSVDSATELIELSLNNDARRLRSAAKLSSPLFSSPNSETPDFHGFDNSVYKSQTSIVQGVQNLSNIQRRISMKQISTPWRSDRVSVRRNPHILFLKDTSLLPSYNQDMVLDPELIEKPISQNKNDTQNAVNEIQTSILDFVNTSKISTHSTPVKKNPNRTLFDEGDFSPIKQKFTVNKENVQEEVSLDVIEKTNTSGVLREKNMNSPLKPRNKIDVVPKKLTSKFGIENYFGFDSPDVNKENRKIIRTKLKRKVNQNQDALPMRVPVKVLKEVAEKLIDNIEVEENADEDVRENEVNDDLPDGEMQNENVPHVGLFEDPEEVKLPERVYARKRTKRVRLVSVDSEIEEEEKPKRKRKDIRTPAEEAAFNKWAAQFNAMCDEVDKYDLEIV
ncbi:hypothetical protein ILUMI_06872 [Ignelater luminosus]|uniref:Uncharacterized protein n=1 Tax=Ignelater luminosus TaxID=2038154 RepID=A0A8K0GEX4_IGNLU|nr:hypothetical protein ILUMI_06872 [Ignelater luminosus]